jgi:hypothetical protein
MRRKVASTKAKPSESPRGTREKILTPEGVSYSVCLALAQIDFDDKFPTIAALIKISPAPLPHFLMFCNIIPALL